jgi:hypothetical protein
MIDLCVAARSEIQSPRLGGIPLYFWVTKEGRQLQLADYPAWPFDDDNVLRAGWKPPES